MSRLIHLTLCAAFCITPDLSARSRASHHTRNTLITLTVLTAVAAGTYWWWRHTRPTRSNRTICHPAPSDVFTPPPRPRTKRNMKQLLAHLHTAVHFAWHFRTMAGTAWQWLTTPPAHDATHESVSSVPRHAPQVVAHTGKRKNISLPGLRRR